jgi:DNA repair exonuclease SbcCD ATPase subunit
MRGISLLHLGTALALTLSPAFADEATEVRLREALRAATEQVQQLQAENSNLKAQPAPQAPAQEPPKDVVSRATYSRAVARLNDQHQADQAQIAKLQAQVQESGKQASDREADKAKTATALSDAQQRIKNLEDKNGKLVAIGNELLQRYQNIGFGEVIGAKEPFVGTTRVELQNLAQDYGDKISDNKAVP